MKLSSTIEHASCMDVELHGNIMRSRIGRRYSADVALISTDRRLARHRNVGGGFALDCRSARGIAKILRRSVPNQEEEVAVDEPSCDVHR